MKKGSKATVRVCRYCLREFGYAANMYRHIKQNHMPKTHPDFYKGKKLRTVMAKVTPELTAQILKALQGMDNDRTK